MLNIHALLTSNFTMSCLCQRQIQKAKCTFLLVYSLHMVTWGFLLVLIILIFTVLLYLTAGFPWSCPFLQSTASWYNRCRWCIRWCSAPKDRPRSILSTSKLAEICLLIQKIAGSTLVLHFSVLPCHWNLMPAVIVQDQKKLEEAIKFANACGAITATKKGAIPSLPTETEVLQLIARA